MAKIPPFRLIAEPMNEAAARLSSFKWAEENIGRRHQLGGEPTFLQPSLIPKCPDCGCEMTFYGQLDSINDEFVLADCGMVYVFVCFECNTVASFIQSF